MSRKTKNGQVPQAGRNTKAPRYEAPQRLTRQGERPALDSPIAWNFNRMDNGGKFKCNLRMLHDFTDELVKLEGKTVEQLMGKAHNHPMSVGKLSPEAKARVDALNLEEETLHQLDLKTPARLWGVLEHNIFYIIWLDSEHGVYLCR